MKRIIIFLLASLSLLNICRAVVVKGTIVDIDQAALSGIKIEAFVSDSVVDHTITDTKGKFTIKVDGEVQELRIEAAREGLNTVTTVLYNLVADVDMGKITIDYQPVSLNEVTVEAGASMITLPNKTIMLTTQQQRDRATSPVSLLAQLSYISPDLEVDNFSKSIAVNGESQQILINGIMRSDKDLNALDPQQIIRIEYTPYIDTRYQKPYINIITVRPPTGGNVMAEVSVPLPRQENHQAAATYRRGNHQVSVNYSGTFRNGRKEYTDQREEYIGGGDTLRLSLEGLSSSVIDRDHQASVEYAYIKSPRQVFLAQGQISYHSFDKHTLQRVNEVETSYLRNTDASLSNVTPSLNVYGKLPIGDEGTLEISLWGAYGHSNFQRILTEEFNSSLDINTRTASRSWGSGIDAFLKIPLGWSTFSAYGGQSFASARNRYTQGNPPGTSIDKMSQTSGTYYLGLMGDLGHHLFYSATMGASIEQAGYTNASPSASLFLQSDLGNGFQLRNNISVSSSLPNMSQQSTQMIQVNELLHKIGNPELKTRMEIADQFTFSYRHNNFFSSLDVRCNNTNHTPFTTYTYVDNPSENMYGKFIEHEINGKRQTRYLMQIKGGLSNIWNCLSLSGFVIWQRLTSSSDNESLRHNSFRGGIQAEAYFGRFMLMGTYSVGPTYTYIGNMLWRNDPMYGLGGSYNADRWSVSVILTDPFKKKAYFQSKTIASDVRPWTSEYWMADKNNLVTITFRYQISFGSRLKSVGDRSISGNNTTDTGFDSAY